MPGCVRSTCPSEAQRQARKQDCYHPEFTDHTQVYNFMKWCRDISGTYILRDSFQSPGQIVASVWYRGGSFKSSLKHLQISTRGSCFYFSDQKIFSSLTKLIDFYAKNDVPSVKGLRGLRLANPITITSTLDRDWDRPRQPREDLSLVADESSISPVPHQQSDTISGVTHPQKMHPPRIVTLDEEFPFDTNSTQRECNPGRDYQEKEFTSGISQLQGESSPGVRRVKTRPIPLPPQDDPEDTGTPPYLTLLDDENETFSPQHHRENHFLFPPTSRTSEHRLSHCSTSSSTSQDSAYISDSDVLQVPSRVKTKKKRFGFFRIGKGSRSKSVADLPRSPLL